MTSPKFPSEEQGGYDPIPTRPEPLSPQHITERPKTKPGINELPEDNNVTPAGPDSPNT
ncbi:hypothetical protein [Pseudomonas nunensis]|uniref:hypothetical protein n=1 Tax=Pseudomonas nunensis TaxID=2961896 RepID=UPI0025B04F44|nr:hypothetical protein [Pseudomonas nunensis]MDN3223142.1 hypothetical protein [Pseudomonas nunensis]